MVVSFATSKEWFQVGAEIDQDPDAHTLPSLATIDLKREVLWRRLKKMSGTATDNADQDMRQMELTVGSRWIRGIREGKHIECKMTPDEETDIQCSFNNMFGGTAQPGKDT